MGKSPPPEESVSARYNMDNDSYDSDYPASMTVNMNGSIVGTCVIGDVTPYNIAISNSDEQGNVQVMIRGLVSYLDGGTLRDVRKQYKPKFSEKILAKAEQFLRDTIGDKHYHTLDQGENVTLKADNGKTYFFNRLGAIGKAKSSRIFTVSPSETGYLKSKTLPMDDLLASFYLWIKTNPTDLESKWGCGQITIEDKTC